MAFLIWALLRSAVVLVAASGLSSAFLLLYMPSLWLSLEAGGYAALATAVVVVTAVPEAEAVPDAVGVGFAMFISWLLAALLWRLLESRVDLPRPLLLVTPGFLAVIVFLALAFFQAEPKDVALVTAAALAASPVFQKLKEEMDTPALTRM